MDTTIDTNKEQPLTLKSLEKHLVKTIFSSLTVALIGALLASFTFYYNTNSDLRELNESKEETKADIKTLKNDVSEIKTTLSGTNIYTNLNSEEVKSLKAEISDIKKQQQEMMKLLVELNSKVKR